MVFDFLVLFDIVFGKDKVMGLFFWFLLFLNIWLFMVLVVFLSMKILLRSGYLIFEVLWDGYLREGVWFGLLCVNN